MTRGRTAGVRRRRVAAYAAFGWSVVFLAPHVYWAAGGTAGLPHSEPLRGLIAVINYAAIVLSALAAALALALARPWATAVPRRILLAGAWAVSFLLGLRGAGGLVQGLFEGGEGSNALVVGFELLFLLGGILFALAAREYSRSPRTGDTPGHPIR
jgi:hypothetical protein